MAELIAKKLACGHVERRTSMAWAIREGLIDRCQACILSEAGAGMAAEAARQMAALTLAPKAKRGKDHA